MFWYLNNMVKGKIAAFLSFVNLLISMILPPDNCTFKLELESLSISHKIELPGNENRTVTLL